MADIGQVGVAAAAIQLTGNRGIIEQRLVRLCKSKEELEIARSRYHDYLEESSLTMEHLKDVVSKVVQVDGVGFLAWNFAADDEQVPADTDQDEGFKIFRRAVSVGHPSITREGSI